MKDIRQHIIERYDLITRPGNREAINKYGFMLDSAETRFMDGITYYRVIFPGSKKGGWAPNYETPVEGHIKDPINSIDHDRPR